MISPPIALPVSSLLAWSHRWTDWLMASAFGRPQSRAGEPEPDTTRADADECRAAMRTVLETQIIPRLVQAHRAGNARAEPGAAALPPPAEIEAFASLCAKGDRLGCAAFIERLRLQGLAPESVLVDLIAPAARQLGRRWEDDTLDFMSVTVGLVLMHELIHALGYEYHDGPQEAGAVRRVMLASAPGSQHVLGLSIVSEFFRKAGWQVVLEVSPSRAELCRAVANEWFDLVGLSVALDAQLPALPELVASLRKASRNPRPPVMLGGPVFLLHALEAAPFGAQAICVDAREALKTALALVGADA